MTQKYQFPVSFLKDFKLLMTFFITILLGIHSVFEIYCKFAVEFECAV